MDAQLGCHPLSRSHLQSDLQDHPSRYQYMDVTGDNIILPCCPPIVRTTALGPTSSSIFLCFWWIVKRSIWSMIASIAWAVTPTMVTYLSRGQLNSSILAISTRQGYQSDWSCLIKNTYQYTRSIKALSNSLRRHSDVRRVSRYHHQARHKSFSNGNCILVYK